MPVPNKYLLLATVQDRLPMMATCMTSIRKYLPDWKPLVVAQEYSPQDSAYVRSQLPKGEVIDHPERIGPHNAKLLGLQHIDRQGGDYVVCSIDDDMEFLPQTRLEPAVAKALEPGVGFVSAGWVRHENLLAKHSAPEEFVKQPIVYTGGGMIFDRATAQIVLGIPEGAYFCDNSEWSLAAYVQGLENHRYRGSVTIHRICRSGGRRTWAELAIRPMPDPKYLRMRPGKNDWDPNNFKVGASEDLTPLAHANHEAARKALLGSTE
jgi:hypothetical protein